MRVTATRTFSRAGTLALLTLAVVAVSCVAAPTAGAASTLPTSNDAAQSTAGEPTHPTLPTAGDLDAYLAVKGSPMAGQGAAFVASGAAWQVDPRLLVAIAGSESGFGQITCGDHNAWGWGCPNHPYGWSSWAEGIDAVAQGLRTNYLADGLTSVAAIQTRYAPNGAANDPTNLNSNWTINVSRFLVELGGDPADVDLAANGVARYPVGPPAGTWSPAGDYAAEAGGEDMGSQPLATGASTRLTFLIRNTGTKPWSPADVRLRRVDDDPRVGSAPFAPLADPTVAPGADGTFEIEIVAAGLHRAGTTTSWQLEGPSGRFGGRIDRAVTVSAPSFAFTDPLLSAPGSVRAGEDAVVTLTLRNAGTTSWRRQGDDPVVLGVDRSSGPTLAAPSWPRHSVPARLLEREVMPGERGSFAFQIHGSVRSGSTVVTLRPLDATGWASGPTVRLSVEHRP